MIWPLPRHAPRVLSPPLAFVLCVIAVAGASHGQQQMMEFSGRLVPARVQSVVALEGGIIQELFVAEGDKVERNQLIARLATRQRELDLWSARARVAAAEARVDELENGTHPDQLAVAESNVEAAEANVKFARLKLDVGKERVRSNTISADELAGLEHQATMAEIHARRAQAELRLLQKSPREEQVVQARSHLEVLKAQRELASLALRACEIRAPFSGTILKLPTAGGHMGPHNAYQICELADLSNLDVESGIPTGLLPRVATVDSWKIQLATLPDIQLTGKTVRVAPAADPASDTVAIRIRLTQLDDIESRFLIPGSLAVCVAAVDAEPNEK